MGIDPKTAFPPPTRPEKENERETMHTKQEEAPHACIEEAGVGFDPSTQHLDLSKEEKRRTTALLMAIQAYSHLIIKDADMYIAISREQGRKDVEAPIIRPATIGAMVEAAMEFDAFISGDLQAQVKKWTPGEIDKAVENIAVGA